MSEILVWLNSHLLIATNICICIFEMFVFWDVGKSFLQPRFDERWKKYLVLLGMAILNQISNIYGNSTIVIVTFFAVCWAGTLILFVGSVWWRNIYAVFFVITQCISELILYLIAFGIGVKDIGSEHILRYAGFGMISKLIAFLILLLVAKGFSKGHIGRLPQKTFFTFLIMPVSSMFILFSVMSFGGGANDSLYIALLVSSIAVLFANAILLHIFEDYAVTMEIKNQYELEEQITELEVEHYQRIEKLNRKNSRYLHNIKHIIQSVDGLLACGEAEQAGRILKEINEEIIEANKVQYCSHSLLNAILGSKKDLADEAGIKFEVEIETVIDTGALVPKELIIVLGNLLDNAIEAASEVLQSGFVETTIDMKNNGSMLFIYVKNNYKTEPKKRGGRLVSRKRGNNHYGHGLDSIRAAVRRCNGVESILFEDKIFIHQVVLSTV